MAGRPVWLASVSYRRRQGAMLTPTEKWSPSVQRYARAAAHKAMEGLGDETLERGFLMCSTLCAHRAVSDAELAALPPGPGGLAGPPGVGLLYETPACPPVSLSFTPCDRRYFVSWMGARLPQDVCGECPSCRARDLVLAKTFATK